MTPVWERSHDAAALPMSSVESRWKRESSGSRIAWRKTGLSAPGRLNLDCVAVLADVEAFGRAEAVGEAGGFVDVAAEEADGLLAQHPFAQRGAAGVLAGGVFVELGIERREMDHEVERAQAVERRERLRDFLFGIFAGSLGTA